MSTMPANLPAASLHNANPKVIPISPRPRPQLDQRQVATPRRRGSLQQGRALETLGHAVEYLVDSRLFLVEKANPKTEHDAVQILMQMSRAVFSECPEVVSMWRRVSRLCRSSFARR